MILTPDYINTYTHIILEQPLKNDKFLWEEYSKDEVGQWMRSYSSNSSYHLCSFDGSFRDCKVCGLGTEGFDASYCFTKLERISTPTLINRIKKCQDAGLNVVMY